MSKPSTNKGLSVEMSVQRAQKTFERWVTAQDAVDDLLRAQLGAERN